MAEFNFVRLAKIYLIVFVVVVFLGTLTTFYYGWVFHVLWSWFVVPSFHLIPLTIRQCAGLMSVLWFTMAPISIALTSKPDDPEKAISVLVAAVFGPLVSLLMGFIILQFM